MAPAMKSNPKLAYPVQKIGQIRQREDGKLEYQIHWAPTWAKAEELNDEAFDSLQTRVVRRFGCVAWLQEAVKRYFPD